MTASIKTPSLPKSYNLPSTNVITQDIRIYIGFIVPGVLDVNVLQYKYEELVRQWPVLGGQLVKSTKHYGFTTSTVANFGSRVINGPLASILPFDYSIPTTSSTATIRSFPRDDSLDQVFHYDTMSILNLPTVKEVAGLRVTVTEDATLLGFYVSHHLCDADSAYHVMKAYCDLINEKDISVNILPPDADPTTPMSSVIRTNEEESIVMTTEETKMSDYVQHNPHVTGTLLLGLIGNTLYKIVVRALGLRWKTQEKYIHLPGPLVEKWRAQVQAELDQAATPAQYSNIQVTKNDIIAAWIVMASYLHRKPSSDPVNVSYIYNYRHLLLHPAFNPKTTYLHAMAYNIIIFSSTMSTIRSYHRSLTSIASTIRRMVKIHQQPSQVRKNLQYHEANPEWIKGAINSIKDEYFPLITSWTFAGFNSDLDFRNALVDKTIGKKKNEEERRGGGGGGGGGVEDDDKGRVVFTHPLIAVPLSAGTDPYIVSMKDGKGGYWLRSVIDEGGWMGVREWLQ